MDIGNTLSSLNSARVVYTYSIYKRGFQSLKKKHYFPVQLYDQYVIAENVFSRREIRNPEYFACVQGTCFIYSITLLVSVVQLTEWLTL